MPEAGCVLKDEEVSRAGANIRDRERLLAAGWELGERGGLPVWRRPDGRGGWRSQEVSLQILDALEGVDRIMEPRYNPLEQVMSMGLKELKEQILVSEKHLEAIESELEELIDLRDCTIIRLAAMQTRLSTLTEAYGGEKAPKERQSE